MDGVIGMTKRLDRDRMIPEGISKPMGDIGCAVSECRRAGTLTMVLKCPLVFCLAFLVVAGCGSGKATVGGKVTHQDGSPLVGANIVLRDPATGKSAHGKTDQQGRFALGTMDKGDGIYPGNYLAIVVENRGDSDRPRPCTIDAKYQSPETSGLSLEVRSRGKQTYDLVLDPPR